MNFIAYCVWALCVWAKNLITTPTSSRQNWLNIFHITAIWGSHNTAFAVLPMEHFHSLPLGILMETFDFGILELSTSLACALPVSPGIPCPILGFFCCMYNTWWGSWIIQAFRIQTVTLCTCTHHIENTIYHQCDGIFCCCKNFDKKSLVRNCNRREGWVANVLQIDTVKVLIACAKRYALQIVTITLLVYSVVQFHAADEFSGVNNTKLRSFVGNAVLQLGHLTWHCRSY